jgi:ankyrin repeat protein
MTPKSDDEVRKAARHLLPDQKLKMGSRDGLVWLVGQGLDEGADIHIDNDMSLRVASTYGHMDVVKLLLDRGANIHSKEEFPLRTAAFSGHKKMVDYLISRGAKLKKALSYNKKSPEDEKVYKYLSDYYSEILKNQHIDTLKDMMGESLRDKMTPIEKEKLNDVILNKINKKELGYFNPLDWGLTLIDYDGSGGLNDHHVVTFESQDGRRWEMTLDERSRYPIMIREMKRGIMYRIAFNYGEVEDYFRKRGLEKLVNEGVRDMMTPKSKEDILDEFGDLTPEELFKKGDWEEQEWMVLEAVKRGFDVLTNNKEGLRIVIRQNYPRVVEYLLRKGVDFSPIGNFDPFYIAAMNGHLKITKLLMKYKVKLNSAPIKVASVMGRPQTANLLQDYYTKTNEGVRDMMTPKSKKEIEEKLEDMEPGERLRTIFNQQIEDISNGIKPYYSQEEIDRMIPQYLEICDFILDIYEKIDDLYYYYNLSVLIRQELKQTLSLLTPSEQIQYVHDLEYLGGLYTDKEWADLGVKAKQDREKKKTNESIKDLMTPKSEEDIKLAISKLTPTDKLIIGCREGRLDMVKEAINEGADTHIGHDTPFIWACKRVFIDIVKYLLKHVEGIDINTVGSSPLRYACERGHMEVVKLLLECGADAELVTKLPTHRFNEFATLLNRYRQKTIKLQTYNS